MMMMMMMMMMTFTLFHLLHCRAWNALITLQVTLLNYELELIDN